MKVPFVSEKKQGGPQGASGRGKNSKDSSDADAAVPPSESIRGLSDLYVPQEAVESQTHDEAVESHMEDIADVLREMGKLTSEQYEQLRQEQSANPGSTAESILLTGEMVDTNSILMAKAKMRGMEFRHIDVWTIEKEVFKKLDIDFIRSNGVMPIAVEKASEGDGKESDSGGGEETLVIATSEPTNVFAIDEAKKRTGMNIRVVVCSAEDIDAACDSFGQEEEEIDYSLDDIISDMTDVEVVQDEDEELEDLEKMAGESPVIKFVNYLISNAIREGASDIHIEPKTKVTIIRYRIDGVLFEIMQSPMKMHPAVVSRIKIMSNLDISERRLPQDGKVSVIINGRGIDLRVSVLPTSHGEKVVIRVLDSKSIILGLEQLGMDPKVTAVFSEQVSKPHGIFLVTGPTGSGKSTTLYTALSQMDGDKLNVSTVEDPVEYELDFCNQVHVNEKIGLDFASALRSLLRQDPDIIMIGEIRDNQTARIAVQAALTGHLVLSTLHTNDAASSITRLVNIGIDAFLIAASLNAVLAQRLVRRICPKCKEVYKVPKNMRKYVEKSGIKPEQLFHGAGCESCRQSGYVGRMGIYELLVIDEVFRDMINKDSSVANMRRVFHESKAASLFDDGIKKVKQGLTTIEEVLRVTEVVGMNENEVLVENVE